MLGRQRHVATCEARIAVTGEACGHPAAEPEQDQRGVRDEQHGLGRLVEPEAGPEAALEQNDSGRRWQARPQRGAGRVGRGAGAVHGHGFRQVLDDQGRPIEAPARGEARRQRVVDGDDRVGGPGPGSLRPGVPAADGCGNGQGLVRLRDVVDRVVDDAGGCAARADLASGARAARAAAIVSDPQAW